MAKKPSAYEQRAIEEIHAWKHPQQSWLKKAMTVINWPFEKAGDAVMATPGVGWVIEKSIGGLVSMLNDAAQWSVRPSAIHAEFQAAGHSNISNGTALFELDLEQVDRVVGFLGAKYKAAAMTEGAATGALGLPGIPADVVALVALNLRAIGEYGTYYGFDISTQQERLFAMNVLGLASSGSDAAKTAAMAQLVKIAQEVAKKRTWKELEKHTFVALMQQIAKLIGIRLTKAKLAQIIPAASAGIGAGFNTYYTNKTCNAAYFLYRERFLAQKYGADIIDQTVKPAEDFEAPTSKNETE